MEYTFTAAAEATVTKELSNNRGNHWLHQRFLFSNSSKDVSLMGSLRIDMFKQERYLPNGIGLKLCYHRQKQPLTLLP